MERFLGLFTEVRAGEGPITLLMPLNVFLLLTTYYLGAYSELVSRYERTESMHRSKRATGRRSRELPRRQKSLS
jgi:hypothetical protein